jgi:hypothetical protein
MNRFAFRRPSASLVVSVLALMIALGGVGYAANKINGSQLVKRSVAGSKLKRKTLTSAEIKGSKLTSASLKSNWVRYSNTVPRAAFYRDQLGVVHLQGTIKNSVSESGTVLTLPKADRPSTDHEFSVACFNGFGVMDVLPSGDVTVFTGTAIGSCAQLTSLDGVTFKPGT